MKTKNAHINALMYTKKELSKLQELFKRMEDAKMDIQDLKKKYNM